MFGFDSFFFFAFILSFLFSSCESFLSIDQRAANSFPYFLRFVSSPPVFDWLQQFHVIFFFLLVSNFNFYLSSVPFSSVLLSLVQRAGAGLVPFSFPVMMLRWPPPRSEVLKKKKKPLTKKKVEKAKTLEKKNLVLYFNHLRSLCFSIAQLSLVSLV